VFLRLLLVRYRQPISCYEAVNKVLLIQEAHCFSGHPQAWLPRCHWENSSGAGEV